MDITKEEEIYKGNATGATPSAFKNEIKSDIERHMEKFSDPLVIGELLHKLLEERENTNRILKNILAKLDRLDSAGSRKQEASHETLLPQVDENILSFIRDKKHATAQEVSRKFNYRGSNAASARLNKLYGMSLLDKKQVGKSVYFFLR